MGELSDALRAEIEREMGETEAYLLDKNIGNAGAVFVAEKLRGNTIAESLYVTFSAAGLARWAHVRCQRRWASTTTP